MLEVNVSVYARRIVPSENGIIHQFGKLEGMIWGRMKIPPLSNRRLEIFMEIGSFVNGDSDILADI